MVKQIRRCIKCDTELRDGFLCDACVDKFEDRLNGVRPAERRWEVHIKNGQYSVAAETLTVEGGVLVFRSNGVITQAHKTWLGVFLKGD